MSNDNGHQNPKRKKENKIGECIKWKTFVKSVSLSIGFESILSDQMR